MIAAPARAYAVTSGKGGVGKSHTAINLGVALQSWGHRVLLLDADLGLANIHVLLGIEPGATIAQVLAGSATLDDVIVHHTSGLDIIPASSGIPELVHLGDGERLVLQEAIDRLAAQYDFLFIDTAAGIGDNVLHFNLAAENVIVVVNDEPTSITDAYALIKVLSSRHGLKRFQILVNSVPSGSDLRGTYAQLAAATDRFLNVSLKCLGGVSEDLAVVHATQERQPYVALYPSSRAALDIARIAKRIAEDESPRENHGGLQFFFRSLVEHR